MLNHKGVGEGKWPLLSIGQKQTKTHQVVERERQQGLCQPALVVIRACQEKQRGLQEMEKVYSKSRARGRKQFDSLPCKGQCDAQFCPTSFSSWKHCQAEKLSRGENVTAMDGRPIEAKGRK